MQAIIQKYNYFPDDADNPAKSLPRTAAILINDTQDSHHFGVAGLVERYLREHNCLSILLHLSCQDGLEEAYLELLRRQNVDGIVMMGSVFQNSAVKKQIQQHFPHIPVVMSNGYFDLPNVYGVLADSRQGSKECVSFLLRKKRRHIAFVNVGDHSPSARLRLQGYEEAMREWGLEEHIAVTAADISLDGGYKATRRLLKRSPELDGLIYTDSLMAGGGLRALRELGRSVPGDVSVLSLTNSLYSETTSPTLTSLDTKVTESCWAAAQVLIGCMINDAGAKKLILPSDIVEREST